MNFGTVHVCYQYPLKVGGHVQNIWICFCFTFTMAPFLLTLAQQVKCFHKRVHGGVDAIFRVQFPSGLVRGDYRLVFPKMDLDDAFKDKRFPDTTKVELLFSASADLINNTGEMCDGVGVRMCEVCTGKSYKCPAWIL